MKRLVSVLAILLAVAVCAGCAGTAVPEDQPESSAAEAQPAVAGRETLDLSDEQTLWHYQELLLQTLGTEQEIDRTWPAESSADESDKSEGYVGFNIEKIERDEGHAYVYCTLYALRWLDPATLEEVKAEGIENVRILPKGDPNADLDFWPSIAVGESVVTINEKNGEFESFAACQHTPYDAPGTALLKANTEKQKAQLEASPRLVDVEENCDPYMMQALWRAVLQTRWIETPEELTLYDLEQLEELELDGSTTGCYPGVAGFRLDAGLLRYVPNLEALTVRFWLEDYSVFENMNNLRSLELYLYDPYDGHDTEVPDLSSLKIGKVKTLTLDEFRRDITVDLTNCNVECLSLQSWVAAVSEFKGCEGVKELEINHTRTDTSLINVETFPDAESIYMQFFSDTPRYRNLSGLGSFGEDVSISVSLDYQAANDKTVASLAGVRLNSLDLDPADGPYPLAEPDPALVAQIDIDPTNVCWYSNPAEKVEKNWVQIE